MVSLVPTATIILVSAAMAAAVTAATDRPSEETFGRQLTERGGKADRLVYAPRVHEPRPVGSIEVRPGRLVLRDAAGRVLFQSDEAARTTVVARNVSIPGITLIPARLVPDAETVRPAVPAPVPRPAVRGPTRFASLL